MRRPAFQFYPADWRNNANLRRCSWAARGVWIEVMGLMHDSDDYGILRWSLKEVAQALGCQVSLVKELATKDVLKGCDAGICESLVYVPRSGRKDGDPVELVQVQAGPIWYSSRMVKDEYVRTIRGDGSRFGDGNSATSKTAPKPPLGDGSTSTSTPSGKQNKQSAAAALTQVGNEADAEAPPPLPADAERAKALAARFDKLEAGRGHEKKTAPQHPDVVAWVKAGVTDPEFREAFELAAFRRQQAGDPSPINPKYLLSFINEIVQQRGGGGVVTAIPRPVKACCGPDACQGAIVGEVSGRAYCREHQDYAMDASNFRRSAVA